MARSETSHKEAIVFCANLENDNDLFDNKVVPFNHFLESKAMKSVTAADIAAMTIDKRIQLMEDLWDSIIDLPEAVDVPDWHREELEKRLANYHENPNAGSPWSDVKERILG